MEKILLIPLEFPEDCSLVTAEITNEFYLGRDNSCAYVLPNSNISRKHAVIEEAETGITIKDLNSSNGTYVNNQKISETYLNHDDIINIGPFTLKVEIESVKKQLNSNKGKQTKNNSKRDLLSNKIVELKAFVHDLLLTKLNLKHLEITENSDELREETRKAIEDILNEKKDIPASIDKKSLIRDILDEALGLGPLELFLDDPTISEIMVNHKDQIYIEQNGKLVLSDKRFVSEAQVRSIIERIVTPLGRRIDESSPLVDARLQDGSRVNAIIPPLALKGCSLTIRKFSKTPFVIDDLIGFKTLNKNMADFLKLSVKNHKNIVISGGTGSGKTTLLNVVSSFIPEDERIVTVEDAAELKLPQEHVVSLETRPPNIEGKGAITIRDLVKNCLRMRPDRIVVGECRGAEALDMLQAMNTGHDGSLTTGHANTPRDMLARLETMVLMAGMDLPSRAIREQVASAVSLIVQQSRFPDGSRRITHITEITGMEGNIITMQDIFVFKQTGYNADGKVQGYFTATGCIPSFVENMRSRGLKVDMNLFEEYKPE